MKSKTSFYNLLLKDITRHFPLWGGYCAVLLLVSLYASRVPAPLPPSGMIVEYYIPRFYSGFKIIHQLSLPFATLCAVVLFGDLYDRKRAMAIYAFPFRRETLFCAHCLAGLLFYLIPTGICLLILKVTIDASAYLLLHFLLCYGLALLCAMLAGNRIGAVLLYLVAYFLPTVTEFLYSTLYHPWLPSMAIPEARSSYDLQGLLIANTPMNANRLAFSEFLLLGGLGILLAIGALVLHHFRKPERTGSFSVFPGLRYPFAAVFSFVAGMVLFLLLHHNRDQFYFLFLYIPVFYFVAAMVTEKRFHVFRKGHILTLCIFAALLFNSIWIVRYDALGILDYVPKAKQVRSVEVYVQDSDIIGTDTYYYQENLFSVPGRRVVAYEDIQQVTQVHEKLLQHRAFYGESCMVYMTYTLKSGIRVRRYYPCPRPLENDTFDLLNQAVSTRDSVFCDVLWEDYVNQVYKIEVSTVRGGNRAYWFGTPENTADATPGIVKIHSRQLQNAFLTALKKSCDDGCLLQLSYDDFTVKVFSRDHWGKEQVLTFSIPCIGNAATPLLTIFEDTARKLPDKTITDDTPLESYDLVFNADGTFIKIPREDLLP